jgi:crotonobetainyl-CoA:carnitine CoA-transferase CaiB-like acyl-CoA transferase
VIAANSDGIFQRLMRAIGRADLAADPALARNDGRARQEDMLDEVIGAWTSSRGLEEVLAVLARAEVPAGRIYTAADIYEDPHFRARGMIEPAALPDGTPFAVPGIVPKLAGTPGETRWLGPALGEHVDQVLGEIGLTAADIEKLRADRIV